MEIHYKEHQNWNTIEFERRIDSNVSLLEELEIQIKHIFPTNHEGVINIIDMKITPIEKTEFNKYTVMIAC